ncbi:MAG: polysaccharide deacetylase family protein [Bacilli bacterium]
MKRWIMLVGGLLATLEILWISPHSLAAASQPPLANPPAKRSFSKPVYYRNQCIVLMYHAVNRRKLPGDVITPQTFSEELSLLRKDHFNVVTFNQLVHFLDKQAPLPPNAVLITFDNGYESFYRTAFPLLRRYHDPAVLFPIVSWLSPPHKKGLFHSMTWNQVEQMYRTGLLSVQSQTFNMHQGMQTGPNSTSPATVARAYNPATGKQESRKGYEQRVLADLLRSRKEIVSHLHERSVVGFAYPFGDYSPLLVQLLHQAGFGYLFTASYGWGNLQSTSPSTIFRLDVGTPYVTAPGMISTIKWIAALTQRNPTWRAPSQYIEVWRY